MLQQQKIYLRNLQKYFRKRVKIMPKCAILTKFEQSSRAAEQQSSRAAEQQSSRGYYCAYNFGREQKNLTLILSFIALRKFHARLCSEVSAHEKI